MINVLLISDKNYFEGLLCTIGSILLSNSQNRFKFYIIDDGITKRQWGRLEKLNARTRCQLKRISVNSEQFSNAPDLRGSYSSYIKLILGSILDCDKVIYFDTDFLVFKDLLSLWQMDLNDNIIAACPDIKQYLIDDIFDESIQYIEPELLDKKYFNSGFMLIDLAKWRQWNIEEKCMKVIENQNIKFKTHDQAVLNMVLIDKVEMLDINYNRFCHKIHNIDSLISLDTNLHYALGGKPWQKFILFGQGMPRMIARLIWRIVYRRTVSKFPYYLFENKLLYESVKLVIAENKYFSYAIIYFLKFLYLVGIKKPYQSIFSKYEEILYAKEYDKINKYIQQINARLDTYEKLMLSYS